MRFKKKVLVLPIALMTLSSCEMLQGLEEEITVVFEYNNEIIYSDYTTQFRNVLMPTLSEEQIPVDHEFYGWTWLDPDSVSIKDADFAEKYFEKDGVIHLADVKDYAFNSTVTLHPVFVLEDDIPIPNYYIAIGWYGKTSTSGLDQARVDAWTVDLKAFLKEFKAVLKYNSLTEGQKDDEGNTILASPYNLYTIDGSTLVKSTCDRSGFIWDTQGRTISFDDTPQAGKNGPKVCIDINGEKAPNRYGVDYFVFMFTTDGYVIPWGQVHKDNPDCTNVAGNCTIPFDSCKYTSNTPDSYSCANYALINQHPTDSGKDYWHDFVRGR